MEATGNIIEGMRFVTDRYVDMKWHHRLMIQHLLDCCSILWQIGKVREQKIILAALLHRCPEDGVSDVTEIENIFGKEVLGYILSVKKDDLLKGESFKRLERKSIRLQKEAGRQIIMADACAGLRQIQSFDESTARAFWQNWIKEDYVVIETFRHQFTELDQYLTRLRQEAEQHLNQ